MFSNVNQLLCMPVDSCKCHQPEVYPAGYSLQMLVSRAQWTKLPHYCMWYKSSKLLQIEVGVVGMTPESF